MWACAASCSGARRPTSTSRSSGDYQPAESRMLRPDLCARRRDAAPAHPAICGARRRLRLCAAKHQSVRPRDRSRCRHQRPPGDGRRLAARRMGARARHADLRLGLALLGLEPANDRDFTGLPITTHLAKSVAAEAVLAGDLRYASHGTASLDSWSAPSSSSRRSTRRASQEQGPAASRWLLNPATSLRRERCNPIQRQCLQPGGLDGLRSDNDIGLRQHELRRVRPAQLADRGPASASSRACGSTMTRRTAPTSRP